MGNIAAAKKMRMQMLREPALDCLLACMAANGGGHLEHLLYTTLSISKSVSLSQHQKNRLLLSTCYQRKQYSKRWKLKIISFALSSPHDPRLFYDFQRVRIELALHSSNDRVATLFNSRLNARTARVFYIVPSYFCRNSRRLNAKIVFSARERSMGPYVYDVLWCGNAVITRVRRQNSRSAGRDHCRCPLW